MIENKKDKDLDLEGVIYYIKNLANNRIYLGQSVKSFNFRYHHNIAKNTHNHILKKDIERYGEQCFKITILASGIEDEELLNMLEFQLIKEFDLLNPKVGYNLRDGGNNFKLSEFAKKQIILNKVENIPTDKLDKIHALIQSNEMKYKTLYVLNHINSYIRKNDGIYHESIDGIYQRVKDSKCVEFVDLKSLTEVVCILLKSHALYAVKYKNSTYLSFSEDPIDISHILELRKAGKLISYTESFCNDFKLSEYQEYRLHAMYYELEYNKLKNLLLILNQNILLNRGIWLQSYETLRKIYNLRHLRGRISETAVKKLMYFLTELKLIIATKSSNKLYNFSLDVVSEQKCVVKPRKNYNYIYSKNFNSLVQSLSGQI